MVATPPRMSAEAYQAALEAARAGLNYWRCVEDACDAVYSGSRDFPKVGEMEAYLEEWKTKAREALDLDKQP